MRFYIFERLSAVIGHRLWEISHGSCDIRLVTLKLKSFLNVEYRYFQCRILKQTWKPLYFGQKLSPGVPVSSLVVLIKSAFIQLLEVRQN